MQLLTDGARLKNVPPPLDLTRILKAYHKRNDRRKFPEKQKWLIPCEVNCAACDWSKTVKHLTHTENFLADMRRGGNQATGFLPTYRYFSFFWLASYFNNVCCTFRYGR